jgi:hypothetical protein
MAATDALNQELKTGPDDQSKIRRMFTVARFLQNFVRE